MQQTMRTLAFACESCVFAYLGMAIFSFPHQFDVALIIWSILFILLGRALNIFPLAYVCNRFRSHQITRKMMVIMWFSGLRGAIAYALSLHLEFKEETRKVLVTTTLVVVLFTTIGNVQLFVNLIFILYARCRFEIVCIQTNLASLAICKKSNT